jgi:hypothetical protein
MEHRVIADWNAKRSLSGFNVGVICIDSHYPIIEGNVQHARTFAFPVLYGIVEGVRIDALLAGDPALEPLILAAGTRLLRQGVAAIVGACGSFANYQQAAVQAFRVPTCMSILTQVPYLLTLLAPEQKLAVYFAAKSAFTARVWSECGITEEHLQRLVIAEAVELDAFRRFMAKPSVLDPAALANELTAHALQLQLAHPDIGAVLLQCSDLPPFAHALQVALGVSVYDVTLVIEWMHRAALRGHYGSARTGV